MSEDALEQIIVDFWTSASTCWSAHDRRVGLDIANANTLVVERADLLGLAQLHQLRGRVAAAANAATRTSCTAEKPLTETAHDRLATIASTPI